MKFDTIERLLAMLLLQAANLETYKSQIGATGADIEEVAHDTANLQAIVDYSALVEANKKAINKIKQQLYNGDPDELISPFPVFAGFAPPFPLLAGALERANRRNRRFKAADDYTKEIGIALGIDGDPSSVASDSVKPTFEASAAATGFAATIIISNRGKSDMWKTYGRRMNSERWAELASGTGKSGNVTIAPTAEGQPERLEVKVQLYKSNEPYGQPSDPQYVTFNP
jgi:hypothetical protein